MKSWKPLFKFLQLMIWENGIMTPSIPEEDIEKRYSFIRPYIPILHGHWGNYWHLATHPEIGRIFADINNSTAKVFFRVGYQGGEAILKKKSNGWKIEESQQHGLSEIIKKRPAYNRRFGANGSMARLTQSR